VIFLVTERLIFRTHELQDENDFVQMHTDPEVRRYVGGQAWPIEKALHRFRTQYLGRPAKTYGLWAAVLKEEEKYVGCCGLRSAKEGARLGFYFSRPYWGRGLATEAATAFVNLGFQRLRQRRILADVDEGNGASEHILEKLGFRCLSREEISASKRVICHHQLQKAKWEKCPR
jgi:[ribosomal protein S5]-alanine N-acetyltransferase